MVTVAYGLTDGLAKSSQFAQQSGTLPRHLAPFAFPGVHLAQSLTALS